MIPSPKTISGFHEWQIDVLRAFDEHKARFFMLEWARRHRKTTLLINLLIREACKVPRAKFAYVAPTQVWARNVVWDDPTMIDDYLPDKRELGWCKNEQKMLISFENGSLLKIGGSDKPDTFRGIDAIGIGFDEWSLCKEELWSEVFRPIIAGPLPPHIKKLFGDSLQRWAMFLYTPKGINHATTMFDTACMLGEGGELPEHGPAKKMRENWYASRMDAEKAGIMTPYELMLAKEDMLPIVYDQEFRCKRLADEERTLITSAMISDLNTIDWEVHREFATETRRIVSIDPAFLGDKCSIRGYENGRTLELRHSNPQKTEQIVAEAKVVANYINTKNFIVDVVGVGRGVGDMLASDAANYNVQFFNSAEEPVYEKDICYNQRAEAYYYTAKRIRKCQVEPIKEKELLRQLSVASRYKASSNGKILIIPKVDVRKELKCSPDDADSYVMANYGLQFIRSIEEEESVDMMTGYKQKDKLKKYRTAYNPMCC